MSRIVAVALASLGLAVACSKGEAPKPATAAAPATETKMTAISTAPQVAAPAAAPAKATPVDLKAAAPAPSKAFNDAQLVGRWNLDVAPSGAKGSLELRTDGTATLHVQRPIAAKAPNLAGCVLKADVEGKWMTAAKQMMLDIAKHGGSRSGCAAKADDRAHGELEPGELEALRGYYPAFYELEGGELTFRYKNGLSETFKK